MIAAAYGLASRLYAITLPNPAPDAPAELKNGISPIISLAKWGGLALCAIGLILAFGSMPLTHNRGGSHGESATRVGMVAIACVGIGAAVSIVGFLS